MGALPAAELAKESVRQSGWITREHAPDQILNNPKLRQAVFSEDVIANKRNSPVVEVTPGVLVAARLLEHKPAKDLAELSLSGTAEYDPLSGGRGLVFGLLFSTVLFCGIVALAILIWAS